MNASSSKGGFPSFESCGVDAPIGVGLDGSGDDASGDESELHSDQCICDPRQLDRCAEQPAPVFAGSGSPESNNLKSGQDPCPVPGCAETRSVIDRRHQDYDNNDAATQYGKADVVWSCRRLAASSHTHNVWKGHHLFNGEFSPRHQPVLGGVKRGGRSRGDAHLAIGVLDVPVCCLGRYAQLGGDLLGLEATCQ